MPTRRSPYYGGFNNPAIGQGFANLSRMFAPPSGSDAYGFAKARETQEKGARIADLYAMIDRPDFDQTAFDRRGVIAGLYAPTQSYYAVDQSNLTSRANNTDDNTRALDQTRLQQGGETTRALLQPVGQGATRFVPKNIAEMYSLPEMQIGTVNAGQGDTVSTPDGAVYRGAPKPRTETEQKAEIIAGMSPELQNALVFGSTPIETVRTPEGGAKPMTRPQVLASGAVPVSDKEPKLANYKLPDANGKPGYSGTAVYDPIFGWKDSQTGAPLPAGAVTYSAQLSGDKAGTGLGPTTANVTDANKRNAEDTAALSTLDLYENIIRQSPGVTGLVGYLRGAGQNAVAAMQDLTNAFGAKAPMLKAAADQVRSELTGVAPELFDEAIPQADFLAGTLAYAIARTENPSGEVSRQAYDRALERVRGGPLSNQAEILAKLGAFRKVLQAKQKGTQALTDPAAARTDTGFQPPADGAVERWERGPDGVLRRAQ